MVHTGLLTRAGFGRSLRRQRHLAHSRPRTLRAWSCPRHTSSTWNVVMPGDRCRWAAGLCCTSRRIVTRECCRGAGRFLITPPRSLTTVPRPWLDTAWVLPQNSRFHTYFAATLERLHSHQPTARIAQRVSRSAYRAARIAQRTPSQTCVRTLRRRIWHC